jgi:hypothetical protein
VRPVVQLGLTAPAKRTSPDRRAFPRINQSTSASREGARDESGRTLVADARFSARGTRVCQRPRIVWCCGCTGDDPSAHRS